MKSIFYVSRINFWAKKAHVYNTAKTCEALKGVGNVEVILISSDNSIKNINDKEKFFQKYSIKNKFQIISLDSFSNYFKNSRIRVFNWIETILANLSLTKYLFREKKNIDIIYFRDGFVFLPVLIAKFMFRKPVFFEVHAVLHGFRGQFLNKILAKISNGLIVISHGLKDYYTKLNSNIIVSFCAASEPERFAAIKETKEELRENLGLPKDKIILGYTGNLNITGNRDTYGIEDIINAMPLLDDNIIFAGVGKKGSDAQRLEDLAEDLGVYDRVLFFPWASKEKIIKYILSFDILLIPSAGAQIGNSPTKMFEYLASDRPIIAANTQAIAEVLNDNKNALLVDYKNPQSWAEAISHLLKDPNLADRLVSQAKQDAKKYTWDKRGEAIFHFVSKTINEKYNK